MHPMVPVGTQLLGGFLDVEVDRGTLAARRDPLPEPIEPGPDAWVAYAAALRERIAEIEAENHELRAGALHPTARHLLDLWLRELRAGRPAGPSIEAVASAPSADFWFEMDHGSGRGFLRTWRRRHRRSRSAGHDAEPVAG